MVAALFPELDLFVTFQQYASEFLALDSGDSADTPSKIPLLPRLARSIMLPIGWRIPFDLFTSDVRIRQHMLIVYADMGLEYGKLSPYPEYYDSLDDAARKCFAEILNGGSRSFRLPSLEEAQKSVRDTVAGLLDDPKSPFVLRRYETIVDLDYKMHGFAYPVCLSVDMQVEGRIRRCLVGFKVEEGDDRQESVFSYVCKDANAPCASAWDGKMQIRQRGQTFTFELGTILNDEQTTLDRPAVQTAFVQFRTHVIASACLAHVNYTLRRLGFSELSEELVTFEQRYEKPDYSARARRSGNGMVIELPYTALGRTELQKLRDKASRRLDVIFSQGNDPSIVYHELGHAFLYLLYFRVPAKIAEHAATRSIEEGFCDFFAAMMAADVQPTAGKLRIGAQLNKRFAINALDAWRVVDGAVNNDSLTVLREGKYDEDEIRKYRAGSVWANMLWKLRAVVSEKEGIDRANQLILLAHVKPIGRKKEHPNNEFPNEKVTNAEVFDFYFGALKRSARWLGIKINATIWIKLRRDFGFDQITASPASNMDLM